jgi:transposase
MEIIRMSKRELLKGAIIARTVRGDMTQKLASQELQMSLRQIKRLCKRFREEGLPGLAHRNRGRASNRKTDSSTLVRVLELIKKDYPDFGPQLIKEQLQDRNHLQVSREWLRGIMIKEGLWKVKERKTNRYYQRRTRRAREGELIQIDGSLEYWFEDRGPKCCLINMVDDATGKLMEVRFVESECLAGYFTSMKRYIETHGRPLALYSDRHTIFKSPKSEEKPKLSQFGRAMKELNIELIHANSPQAKGRVERAHGTLQDRLIKLMRLDGISTIEEGNRYLEAFKLDYNKRFGRFPRNEENAHRELEEGIVLDRVLCIKEERRISQSLEVRYKHTTYQLIPKSNGRRLIGKMALVSDQQDNVIIEIEGEEYGYRIYEEQPFEEKVIDHKKIDAFLNRKATLSNIAKRRRGIAVNF